jgi:hypothetical protein
MKKIHLSATILQWARACCFWCELAVFGTALTFVTPVMGLSVVYIFD